MSALAIALAVTVLAAGGPAAVDVRLSPAVAHVGDTVTLEIAVRAFGANTIRIEPLPGSVEEDYVEDETLLGSDLLVRIMAAEEKRDLLGALVARRTYRVVPFTVGGQAIRPVAVKVVMQDGSEINLATPALSLDVLSTVPGAKGVEKIAELKGLLLHEAAERQSWLWLWILLGAVALAAGCAAVIALNKRTPKRLRKLMELTPAQRALQELARLAASGLLEDGKTKEFYIELSEIVRRYIGMRFRQPALEMTTTELSAALEEHLEEFGFSLAELSGLLQTSDMVKFAKLEPPFDTGLELMESAREMVITTRDDLAGRAPGRTA